MKINKLLMGLLGAFALTACSNEKIMPDEPNLPEDEMNTRFMTVSIRNAEGNSRAGGDQAGDLYEEGLDQENKIESLRFYFFKENGDPYVITAAGKSYYDCTEIVEEGKNMPYVEKKLKAVIVLSSTDGSHTWNEIDRMLAVANFDGLGLGDDNKSLSQLKEISGSLGFESDRLKLNEDDLFVMTSSSFGAADGYGCEVKVSPVNIKATREEAEASPVEMYVERVLSKVRVSTSWSSTMETETVKFDGKDYVAVKLTEKDKTGEDRYIKTNDGKQIYVVFTGWDLSGHTDKSYLFKQVNPAWSFDGWAWNDPDRYRSYWAMNAKDVTFHRHRHSDATAKIGSKRQSGSSQGDNPNIVTYDGDALYCQENAADWSEKIMTNTGRKSSYNPDTQVGNRTQAYFRAVLVNVDEAKNATPVDLAIWGDVKYAKQDLVIAMLNSIGDLIYTGDETNAQVSLGKDDVELVNGQTAGMANDQSENSRRYLSYIQLKPNLNKTLYKKSTLNGETSFSKLSTEEANAILSNMPGARCWDGGDTYYYVDIAHLNRNAGAEETGLYGIVRNHIYDIEINTVYGLGTPVLNRHKNNPNDPEDPIIPQKPSNEAYYLGARLNILSWRVVNQNVSLDW